MGGLEEDSKLWNYHPDEKFYQGSMMRGSRNVLFRLSLAVHMVVDSLNSVGRVSVVEGLLLILGYCS